MQPVNDRHFTTPEGLKDIPSLTKERVKLLETATCLNYKERVRLLALLACRRWLTEVDIRRDKKKNNPDVISLLEQLGLAWYSECYIKKDGTKVYWIEVGLNGAVVDYVKKNSKKLSVLEAGILYGYPITAVLACSGVIREKRKTPKDKTPAESCLGGVFSSSFTDEESDFLNKEWEDLRQISPKVVAKAEKNHLAIKAPKVTRLR